ncbi:MAG: septal ring lytic transglycosylase RlpA family protein [Pseudomonadota bacterium]
MSLRWTPIAAIALALALLSGCAGPIRRPAPPQPEPVAPTPAAVTAPLPAQRPPDSDLLALPDAVPVSEPRARLGNPTFYEVFGQRYTVLHSAHGFVERGVASWYGPDFHGIRTSTGEPYNMYSMTAAHRTLPLPAYARVTNLRNGQAVTVRINDRGPFKANRIIDLSYAAALKLGMVREGTTLVEVQALDPADGAIPEPTPPAALYAQAGAFGVEANALRLRDRLAAAGLGAVFVRSDNVAGHVIHRVRLGPIDSVPAYDAIVERLHAAGIPAVTLVGN